MLIGILDQLDSTKLLIGLAVFFFAQMFFFRYMFGRLNANPADPAENAADRDSEILGDPPVRSAVGTPRPKRLQPAPRTFGADTASTGTEATPVPVGKITVEKTDVPVEKTTDPYAPLPLVASAKPAAVPEEAVPLPALASLTKPEPIPEKAPALSVSVTDVKMPEPVVAAAALTPSAAAPEPPASKSSDDKISLPPISLPPLATETPAPEVIPALVPVPLMPAASLVQTPETKTAATPLEPKETPVESKKEGEAPKAVPAKPAPVEAVPVPAIPRRFFVNPFAKAAAPAEAKTEPKPDQAPMAPVSTPPEPVAVAPVIESGGDGIVAISGPTPLEPTAETTSATEAEESDDVKKRKTPKTSTLVPERAGLILIPPATVGAEAKTPIDKPAETVATVGAKAEPPPGALTLASTPSARTEPVPVPPATKLVGRPRIFLPANAPTANAPKEEIVAENPAPEPVVPAETVGAKDTVTVPDTKAEAKTEPEIEGKLVEAVMEVKPEELPVLQSKAAPESEKIEEVKADEKPSAAEAKTEAPTIIEETKPAEEPAKIEAPSAVISVPEPEPETPAVVLPAISKPVEPVAAVEQAVERPSVPPPLPTIPPPLPEAAKSEEKAPALEVFTPLPIPMLPKTVHAPAAAPEGSLSAATTAPANSITTPEPAMPTTDTSTNSSATGRASAQLTLGFEITSLQLTPFFKLGAVQLRPLSNVVSLHLIGAQPENPLAAGISFQIDRVELEGSKIKSLHLKLLGGAQAATTPQPKLQVNSVELSQASEGAPISITPSDQTSTAVQLLATFTIAAMDFTPSFEIGSLRLEPTSNQVMLRLAPSSRPAALDLPPSFDISTVQLGGDAQISAVALTPSAPKAA